jgi:uncharacterized membrane protein YbaN (DUF454 family)
MSEAGERCGKASGAVRYVLLSAGFICVGFGVAGIFVPLLPTTPFLLLAAACFLRSSDRFYCWLTTNRWVGGHVRNYMEHKATTLPTKVGSITMLWCALVLAGALFAQSWVVRSLLFLIGVGVTSHLVTLKTIRQETAAGALSKEDTGKERAQ